MFRRRVFERRAAAALRWAVAGAGGGSLIAVLVFVGAGQAQSTYEGASLSLRLAGLGAAVALAVVALLLAIDLPTARVGALAACCCAAWLAPIVVGWQQGPGRVRTAASIAAALVPAIEAAMIAALPVQTGWFLRAVKCTVAVAAFGAAAAVSVALALVRDPLRDLHCWSDCTVPPALTHRSPELARQLSDGLARVNLTVGLATCALSVLLALRASAVERRAFGPALLAGTAAGLAQVAYALALLTRPPESPTRHLYEWLFAARAGSLVLLAIALGWCVARPRLVRGRVRRLALDLGRTAAPGGLAGVLATTFGDAELEVLFPVEGGLIDAAGASRRPDVRAGPVTPLLGSAGVVAYLSSTKATLETVGQSLGPAAELALGNERLRAETLARLREVTESRARLVEAAEGARRRMERDLHDGAQQRMLALGYDLLVAISHADQQGDEKAATTLRRAHERAADAARELREIAGGLYPPSLHQYGLVAALDSLADTHPLSVTYALARVRYPARVEAAAYAVISEAAAALTAIRVVLAEEGGSLHLTLEGWSGESATWFDDRAGAVGGTVNSDGGTLEAWFPIDGE